jgi:hypothetical protein
VTEEVRLRMDRIRMRLKDWFITNGFSEAPTIRPADDGGAGFFYKGEVFASVDASRFSSSDDELLASLIDAAEDLPPPDLPRS